MHAPFGAGGGAFAAGFGTVAAGFGVGLPARTHKGARRQGHAAQATVRAHLRPSSQAAQTQAAQEPRSGPVSEPEGRPALCAALQQHGSENAGFSDRSAAVCRAQGVRFGLHGSSCDGLGTPARRRASTTAQGARARAAHLAGR